jgi:hypothetical protein
MPLTALRRESTPRRNGRATLSFGHPAAILPCSAGASALERDEISPNRHPALAFSLRMIFSENRLPLFGIMR